MTMPSVDPAKIVAEEQAEEDKKPKESTESTLAVCKKDLARGKMMLESAIRTSAGSDMVKRCEEYSGQCSDLLARES